MTHAAERVIDILRAEGLLSAKYDEYKAIGELNTKLRGAIDELPFVELHPAHSWDCENCGTENFSRCVLIHSDEDQDGDGDLWVTAPATVTCHFCATKYLTKMQEDTEDA